MQFYTFISHNVQEVYNMNKWLPSFGFFGISRKVVLSSDLESSSKRFLSKLYTTYLFNSSYSCMKHIDLLIKYLFWDNLLKLFRKSGNELYNWQLFFIFVNSKFCQLDFNKAFVILRLRRHMYNKYLSNKYVQLHCRWYLFCKYIWKLVVITLTN